MQGEVEGDVSMQRDLIILTEYTGIIREKPKSLEVDLY